MAARRVAGIAVALLMMHLTFVGADFACAQHGTTSAVGHEHAMAHHQAHAIAVHVEDAGSGQPPCEIPSQPQCCQALTSCTIAAALDGDSRSTSVPFAHVGIASALMRAPLSRIVAPDPPPPKA
jgi:hypothetical protein